ncbi:MAG TPA: S41 family peptidase [Bryobacteraceae bacterium]|nr:S41 family peptidase [Bryobacteraceae bacterium]
MRLLLVPVFALCLCLVCAGQNHGYYRFPAIHGDTVVFTSEGDLWEVSVQGGAARRLTTHPSEEIHPAFSPDGKTIAFSASYEGPSEVYTMPAGGGLPTRRTFHGAAGPSSVSWTPDGKVLYSTYAYSTLPDDQLVTLDEKNRPAIVPLSQAAQGCYDAKGSTLFFTRLPAQGSSTKRYKGGTAQHLWKYTPGQEAVPLTADYAGTSKEAMWWNNRVYFLSDRDGTMNLWSMDEDGRKLRQHTHYQGWDIQSPSLSRGRIAYQLGADIHVFDVASGDDKTVPIELPSDFDHLREHWVKNPMQYVTSAHLSPDGDRVVLTSRGKVFVAPAKPGGRLVSVAPREPGRFRDGRLMPDGKSLLVLSTESGELEFWKYPANGEGSGEKLTEDGKVLRWEGIPSPDGKWIVHQDKNNRLWLFNIGAKSQKQIALGSYGGNSGPVFESVRWSPDSRWITYGEAAPDELSRVMLYSLDSGAITPLTTDRYDNGSAAWSADGKWIYFLSDRELKSVVKAPWGSRQPDPYFDRSVKIYQLPLQKGLRSPFEPADELHPESSEKKDEPAKSDDKTKPAAAPKVEIDLDGIVSRLEEVPVPASNFGDLGVAGKRLCWINRDPEAPDKNSLQCLDIANKGDKPETLMEGVNSYEISSDGKKLLVRKKDDLWVLDAAVKESALKDPKTLADAHVELKDWTFSVIPSEEFREAFVDAWRLHRDYFYDPHMHGVNWPLMRAKYSELAGRVHDRAELNDLIAQMVGELSMLHTFVVGGDLRHGEDQIELAFLGAQLAPAGDGAGYEIQHIYRSDPDRPDKLSPLLRAGVNIAEGDVVISINGRGLESHVPGELLRGQAGKPVLLRIRPRGQTGTRDVLVKPLSSQDERDLRYREWEYTRRLAVEQKSAGEIGYVHLRAMGGNDINQWVEEYSPVFKRQGLIIDVRHNQGGNIDSWILGKLLRKAWMYWKPREGEPLWNMQQAFRGHLVVLCDEWTASDGEAFTEGFRRLGLGKVIGTRTWGGEVWLSFSNFLADRGIASTGELGVYGPEGKWLIEGHGVDPDIVQDNLPHAAFEGQDSQLEVAIQHLQRLIRERPAPIPPAPPYPDKSLHESSK